MDFQTPGCKSAGTARADSPPISVIVISVNAGPLLPRAVQSVLDQDVTSEVIVVNSAGGDTAARLGKLREKVTLIEREQLLYVGAARNLGIAASHAPVIAFLAEDCVAAPGWLRERLRHHHAGAPAVASAMLHDRPLHLVAWAHQLLLFPRRLPYLPAREVILYSVSFDRILFDRYGLYEESLKTGEDSEFLKRLAAADKPVWAPEVHTLHHNKTNPLSLLGDQFRRGRRYGTEVLRIFGRRPQREAKQALRHSWQSFGFAKRGLRGRDRVLACMSVPIVAMGCIAKALGLLSVAAFPEEDGHLPVPARQPQQQTKSS